MKFRIPTGRGLTAAISIVTALAAAAPGGFTEDEVGGIVIDELAPRVREVVVKKGDALRATREKRGTLGRTTFERWVDSINDAATMVRFKQWATSAFADGKLDEGEISDLLLAHVLPAVVSEVADALKTGDGQGDQDEQE